MKPVRFIAILFLTAVLLGMVGVVALGLGGFIFGTRSAVQVIEGMSSDEGQPVQDGVTKLDGALDSLSLSGPYTVHWKPANDLRFEVSGPADLRHYVTYKRQGDGLHFGWNKKSMTWGSTSKLTVTVFGPSPDSVSIGGSGTIVCDGLDAGEMSAAIGGSGEIELRGKAKGLDVSIGGSGDLNAFDLAVDDASVSIGGSGSADVNAKNRLQVSIAGSGDVNYRGNPQIERSIVGSGDVNRRD